MSEPTHNTETVVSVAASPIRVDLNKEFCCVSCGTAHPLVGQYQIEWHWDGCKRMVRPLCQKCFVFLGGQI